MHPLEVKRAALSLVAEGLNDCEISRTLGIPRATIRDWRKPSYVKRRETATCPRCWRATKAMVFKAADYAQLLGLYLGDGTISRGARTDRLRITLDNKYPQVIEEAREVLERCFPENSVGLVARHSRGDCGNLWVYSQHLTCLFPQHGPGRKHLRKIELESWQGDRVESAPWAFLRGCMHSDGCHFINRTDIHRDRPYEYLSYGFANMSIDIVGLFTAALERVGIADYRQTRNRAGLWQVRINRRGSVALLQEHVGLKR